MSYILGLDTGGTYTDGVLIDTNTEKVVAKAKALTTKHDLRVGIEACIDSLEIKDTSNIKMVSLSTTLATNAVVENRCGKTGLILVGDRLRENMPTEYIEIISGEADIKGNVLVPISEEEAAAAVNKLKKKVDAIAISAYASVRNPQEELRIKRIVEANTELPVFCAHELAGSLGYAERTTTAVLNAGLIGIINDFLTATKESLGNKNINAEIMIVKSDGSLMRESVALKRPIDTILSGPAASAIGAKHLTGIDNALILDMGGTTIDIADVSNGIIKSGDNCAKVGGWRTKVHAVEVSTHGIGGDSLITFKDEFSVGPQKAEPISRTAYYNKEIHKELESILKDTSLSKNEKVIYSRCYCLINGKHIYNGDNIHDRIVDMLRDSAHSMMYIMDEIGCDIEDVLSHMVSDNEINMVDLTPTDILHLKGRYVVWDIEAALLRSHIIAEAGEVSLDEFIFGAEKAVYKRIYTSVLQAIADFEQVNADLYTDDASNYLIDKVFSENKDEFMSVGSKLNKPLVAVGAPADTWVCAMRKIINAELISPENADVANAIGSAFGKVSEFAEALIRKNKTKRRYDLYLPSEKKSFRTKKMAMEEAERILKDIVAQKAHEAGCDNSEIELDCKELYMVPFGEKRKTYIETKVKAYAKGRPNVWNA